MNRRVRHIDQLLNRLSLLNEVGFTGMGDLVLLPVYVGRKNKSGHDVRPYYMSGHARLLRHKY